MKRVTLFIAIGISFTLIFLGCQSTSKLIQTGTQTVKVVTPREEFIDDNIEVIHERAEQNVDRTASLGAKAARLPVRFWDTFAKRFRGESDVNPYDRGEPYTRKEFQQDMLVAQKEGITQPQYMRGERYAKAYRSPFIFREELERGGTSEMTTVADASSSLMAKQYLDLQKDLERDLMKAEKLYADGDYAEALELVDNVLDMDSSSQQGRVLFEKIIRQREQDKMRQEEEMRAKIAIHDQIGRYLAESREYLEEGDFQEALRISKKALSLDPTHAKAREMVDTIELTKFEEDLKRTGTSSFEILERMIYKHLHLYQQYSNENLGDLARKELQKVSILESYRDKLSGLQE